MRGGRERREEGRGERKRLGFKDRGNGQLLGFWIVF